MLSQTLSQGLAQYEIGAKIKALRLGKGLGQAELGAHTGLSPALLSKIERGQIFPTLPTLLRIALVFGVGLEHFFMENDERPALSVTRKKDRVRLPEKMGQQSPAYLFESLDFSLNDRKMSGYYAIFPPTTSPSAAHQHAGEEMIYVLKGQLAVEVGGTPSVLDEGDSIHFVSDAPHSYRCHGRSTAIAIVVVADQAAR
jgi:transcriptional regulator with XRE-family HTH domain